MLDRVIDWGDLCVQIRRATGLTELALNARVGARKGAVVEWEVGLDDPSPREQGLLSAIAIECGVLRAPGALPAPAPAIESQPVPPPPVRDVTPAAPRPHKEV